MGCAYRKLGQETAVRKYFAKATQGSSTPEVSRCYNDQSSGYIYYQDLAFHALDEDEKAKALPHNSSAALAMPFLPFASCRNLDLPPVNLRFLQSHLTKNAFAIAPTHLCGIALRNPSIS